MHSIGLFFFGHNIFQVCLVPVDATTNAGSLQPILTRDSLGWVLHFSSAGQNEKVLEDAKTMRKKGWWQGKWRFLRHKTGKPKLDLAKICAELRLKLCQGLLAKLLQHDDVLWYFSHVRALLQFLGDSQNRQVSFFRVEELKLAWAKKHPIFLAEILNQIIAHPNSTEGSLPIIEVESNPCKPA